jgi:hypothetical protein
MFFPNFSVSFDPSLCSLLHFSKLSFLQFLKFLLFFCYSPNFGYKCKHRYFHVFIKIFLGYLFLSCYSVFFLLCCTFG